MKRVGYKKKNEQDKITTTLIIMGIYRIYIYRIFSVWRDSFIAAIQEDRPSLSPRRSFAVFGDDI